jgi:hypothetical protein
MARPGADIRDATTAPAPAALARFKKVRRSTPDERSGSRVRSLILVSCRARA